MESSMASIAYENFESSSSDDSDTDDPRQYRHQGRLG